MHKPFNFDSLIFRDMSVYMRQWANCMDSFVSVMTLKENKILTWKQENAIMLWKGALRHRRILIVQERAVHRKKGVRVVYLQCKRLSRRPPSKMYQVVYLQTKKIHDKPHRKTPCDINDLFLFLRLSSTRWKHQLWVLQQRTCLLLKCISKNVNNTLKNSPSPLRLLLHLKKNLTSRTLNTASIRTCSI